MKECWPEGALRAYLDGELAPAEMQAVASHLGECASCERVHAQVSARAGYVAGLMSTLAEPLGRPAQRRGASRASASWRWTAAAVAVAAGLAIATILIPKRAAQKPVPGIAALGPQPVVAPPPTEVPRVQAAQLAQTAPSVGRVKRRLRVSMEGNGPFLALDDEPIENGIVMRVTVPGSTPADIVFSPDGRARAIRLVNGTSKY
jgi:anti-sigma factor RsiW